MCGICGFIRSPSSSRDSFLGADELLDQMISQITHRGPDHIGKYLSPEKNVGLGHCRLSIIDLSPAGNQPMCNEDGSVWIVFNGEIYNYSEIKPELQKRGHKFSSNSDTEIVLHAFEEWGIDCLNRFRGFWALAVWDQKTRELILARDRLGEKPIYYCKENDTLYFSSELKSLWGIRDLQLSPSPQAIHHYLSYYAVPGPETIWKNVQSLEAGNYLSVRDGSMEKIRYWDLPSYNPIDLDQNLVIEEIRRLLLESVRYRLVSDVPVGAFLSGGIDSTLAVALMNRLASEPVQTFSVGFGKEGRDIDERAWARKTAECLRTRHSELVFSGRDVRSEIDNIVWGIDQPSGDGVNTYLVAKAASQSVRVVISGIGGDESFLGYRPMIRLQRLRYFEQIWRCFPDFLRTILSTLSKNEIFKQFPGSRNIRRAFELFEHPTLMRMRRDEDNKTELYCLGFLDALGDHEHSDVILNCWLPTLNTETIVNLTRLDIKHYLHSTLLRDFDVMTMIHSLEGRAPFLDHKLVEFAFNIPPEMKYQKGIAKHILLEAFKDVLPKHILKQPKRGFEIPMDKWLRSDLKGIVDDTLSVSSIKYRGIFEWASIQSLVKKWDAKKVHYMDIWSLVVLELWFRKFSPATRFR